MAVAAYTTDLTVIVDMDGTTGTAAEPLTVYTAGRSPINNDTDIAIQGTNSASLTFNATGKGGVVVTGGTRTWTSGDYLFGWITFTAPNALSTKSGGGLSMLCGTSNANLKVFYVGGSDFGTSPYGGYQNFAVNPEGTADETLGTSPTDFYVVGAGASCATKVNKGNPLGFDVFRYGRGEIRIVGGTSTDPDATFTGMATANDGTNARWGLFQEIEGGYKWKGLMYFGYGNATNFTDSGKSIVVDNVDQVASTFNAIEIHNASSVIDWVNINITSLSSVSPGSFEMIDNATFTDVGGVFTDMDTFIYQSGADITGRTWRRCGQITSGGASFTDCTFDSSTSATTLSATTLANITNCKFISDGSNHAINLGTVTSSPTWAWDSTLTGYASSDGSTGNEAIRIVVNTPNVVTINVSTGSSIPSIYHTGTGTVIVNSGVPVSVSVTDDLGIVIENARVHIRASDVTGDLPYKAAITSITSSSTTATVTTTDTIATLGIESNDKVLILGTETTEKEYTGVFQITVTGASTFTYTMSTTASSPASGTSTLTFVAIDGLTDVDGEISSSRNFTADQPIIGWARKSTSSPYYKQGTIVGSISYETGLSKSAVLVSDE